VLGWLAAASVVAALVYPLVNSLARFMRRGLALVVVVVLLLATVGSIVYAAVDDVRTEIDHLQEVAPDAAAQIEQSQRYGEAARDFHLRDRVQSFVDQLPERLAGGSGTEAIRSATTRGLAYFVAFILTLFLVLYGPHILRGALAQVGAPGRREYLTRVLTRAYARAWTYLVGSFLISVVTGFYAYAWCRAADLPGATVLAIFVALLALIPSVGTAIGSLPILLLAFGLEPDSAWTFVLALAFLGWQVFDVVVMRRMVNRRSIAVGPAVTVLVAMLGLDLYGIGGALVGFAYSVFVVAVVDELAPTDEHAVDLRSITG
jgi:predicted PurR-regulated permease PerM